MKPVYVTRDNHDIDVEVWPATVGIRKFHGCIMWGAAWRKESADYSLYSEKVGMSEDISKSECRKRFGFYPAKGTAWYINSRGKRSKVDIDFSP
ncbi:hypothetical protein LCGC14_0400580 [marine sediment metagenome]|uniref:Uncharacterized protein n=1 Tax=marine sediment metagenome TaxID=412755 RepID=A0A0F9W630_9ZZZZ